MKLSAKQENRIYELSIHLKYLEDILEDLDLLILKEIKNYACQNTHTLQDCLKIVPYLAGQTLCRKTRKCLTS